MAVITTGPLISDIRGTIGGITFQNGAAGLTARQKPTAKKVRTIQQQLPVQALRSLTVSWHALTLAQQVQWDDYASIYTKQNVYGRTLKLTGFNWFTSMNFYRVSFGLSTFSLPPARVLAPSVRAYTLVITSTEVNLVGTAPYTETNVGWIVRMSKMISSPFGRPATALRTIGYLNEFGNPATNYRTAYSDAFGFDLCSVFVEGSMNIVVEVMSYNKVSGLTSPPLRSYVGFSPALHGIGAMAIGSTFIVH